MLTALSISIIGVYNLRLNIMTELDVSASIVGDRNAAALLFNDNKRAEENLSVFGVKLLYNPVYIAKTAAYLPTIPTKISAVRFSVRPMLLGAGLLMISILK